MSCKNANCVVGDRRGNASYFYSPEALVFIAYHRTFVVEKLPANRQELTSTMFHNVTGINSRGILLRL